MLHARFYWNADETYPLTPGRKSRTRRLISLPIAHPKKLAHGPNWRETASFAVLLLISTLISKLLALFKSLIFSLDCPFKRCGLHGFCLREQVPVEVSITHALGVLYKTCG